MLRTHVVKKNRILYNNSVRADVNGLYKLYLHLYMFWLFVWFEIIELNCPYIKEIVSLLRYKRNKHSERHCP